MPRGKRLRVLNNDEEFSRFHYIVPAPWYPSDGGAQFDHVAKLLTEASKYMGWTPTPFGHSILKKTARTEHMAGKDLPARLLQQNEIYQALEVPSDAPAVRGCRVLVVDDLMTSGVTLNAAARRLREHGAEEVSGLCLLRSVNAILLD